MWKNSQNKEKLWWSTMITFHKWWLKEMKVTRMVKNKILVLNRKKKLIVQTFDQEFKEGKGG